jgi:hypothetical protein
MKCAGVWRACGLADRRRGISTSLGPHFLKDAVSHMIADRFCLTWSAEILELPSALTTKTFYHLRPGRIGFVSKDQRLREADHVGVCIAAKRRTLDFVEPAHVKEDRYYRVAVVRAHDAQVAAEHPADPLPNVELDLASQGKRLHRAGDFNPFIERS